MTTFLFTHPACLEHDPGSFHPERPERLIAILQALEAPAFRDLQRREGELARLQDIAAVHDPKYVEQVLGAVPQQGYRSLDGDTSLSPGSGRAALAAAGAVIAAIDAVMEHDGVNAFCAVRPPGHHAEHDVAMGFCLFNNVAIGARYAQRQHGLRKVAIIDFDVHHGNGTQHIFAADPTVFYASIHQMPLYPGTGAETERGLGNICNVPVPPYSGKEAFRDALERKIFPALDRFQPDLLMISAGFDAHIADPLAQLRLESEDFGWMTELIGDKARIHCRNRLVSVLEGGYVLDALAESVAEHVSSLMKLGQISPEAALDRSHRAR